MSAEVEIKHFSRDRMTNRLRDSLSSKSERTQQQKYICIAKWGKRVLQIGAALFYYKLGQTLLQIGAALLLQIGASAVTIWHCYYKLGQLLLQNRAAITNQGNYYKLGHSTSQTYQRIDISETYLEFNQTFMEHHGTTVGLM